MKLSELKKMVDRTFADFNQRNGGDPEVVVWLPGSTIDLTFNHFGLFRRGDKLCIEGNVTPGSALERE